ncbi:hypothetical protein COCON_G00149030 [Conger conger]|uniref:Immunoglobulin domain-containing protein n=1 Tax=Conger conger TaxID=82655 RepID=A0A9Q1HVU5_CONCO|nr:hypothetical protein COCON_G00149030 [Conger conger]
MIFPLQILSLLAIHWTAMGHVLEAHGTEGGDLNIKCPYPDDYLHRPKYVCRHPCGRWDVLITSAVSERAGRFLLNDNSVWRFFTVTIIKLSLQDAGLYYCGIETWGRDWMVKVKVTVSKDYSMETATVPLTLDGNNGVPDSLVVVGAALGVLACLIMAALVAILRGRSVSKSLADSSISVDSVLDEEDPEHVYDEYTETVVYSTIGLPQEESEQAYCTVQFSDLPSNENDLYSLVMMKVMENYSEFC